MEIFSTTTLLIIVCLIFLILSITRARKHQNKDRLPPGPTPLPFIGNILQLNGKEVFKSLNKLSEKYGPVYTIHMGMEKVVVLCSYDAVKEALIDNADDFGARGHMPLLDRISSGGHVVASNGERWKQLRRFSLMTLRNFGMGKKSIEERIQEEAHFLTEEFRKTNSQPVDPTFYFSKAVSNVICSVVFGNRFEYEDKCFLQLLAFFNEIFRGFSSVWGQEKDVPHTEFHKEGILNTTFDLFGAGTETVSTTLRYGLLILLKHADVEECIHKEIDNVIGRNRAPCIEDRSRMPYLEAVIHEIQRFIDLIPMGIPHKVTRDVHFRGFIIPKDTTVYTMLSSVLRDPKQFKYPNEFNPGHFLDENGKFRRNEGYMPFSSGKRICLGEGLAKMELFLFFSTILQNFTLRSPVDPKDLDLTPLMSGFGNIPRPYELCFIPR
ncbi:PREDICTED: cytochrome P450 2G1-like isoform X4 [Nanorana parkeri]|uniref:cytochrome P450 2G1-like isoform X4 n=1 Tax=Nanorana parkeri TaxID=125878 RepID=UPI0008543019|nr:PREDICTED: cytochrome P450 2G1-like isoform X4 [Nanorana parkeri]